MKAPTVIGLLLAIATFAWGEKDWRQIVNGPDGPRGGEITIKPGEKMAEVVAYDEQGKPFPLSRLKGKHTVLIFGCLT